MTSKQRNNLMIELWPEAARAQGWKVGDRELRLRVLSIALMCPVNSLAEFVAAFREYNGEIIASANQINEDAEFTKVKNLLLLLADNLDGAGEVGKPQINKTRQKRHVILTLLGDLAGLPAGNPMGVAGAEAYVLKLMQDKFKRSFIEDLSDEPIHFTDKKTGKRRQIPSQLAQLLITLDRRVKGLREGGTE